MIKVKEGGKTLYVTDASTFWVGRLAVWVLVIHGTLFTLGLIGRLAAIIASSPA